MPKFGFLYGNKGRRKYRSPKFESEKMRDKDAEAYRQLGFRVRKYKVKPPKNKPPTMVV